MQRSTLANMLFCHKGIVQPKPPVKGGIRAYGNGQFSGKGSVLRNMIIKGEKLEISIYMGMS